MEELIIVRKNRRDKINKRKKNKRIKLVLKIGIAIAIVIACTTLIINKIYIDNKEIVSDNNVEPYKSKGDNYYTYESEYEVNNFESDIIHKKDILIVNKENSIDKDYMPEDLIVPNILADKEVQVRAEVAEKIEEMFAKAKEDGISLVAISGYRTYDYQNYLYTNSIETNGQDHAEMYVAEAGYSEHQTGLAMDLACKEYMTLDEGFEDTEAFKWLENNMSDYGFILRYLKGKEKITGYNYEPWHIRYVGIDIAKDIEEKGVTLEEYVGV